MARTYLLNTGAIPGLASRPAKPGDTIVLYGVGFGPVTPAIPVGQLVGVSNTPATSFQMSIGNARVCGLMQDWRRVIPCLYQFNITVPNVASGNSVPLTLILNGVASAQTLYIAVQD